MRSYVMHASDCRLSKVLFVLNTLSWRCYNGKSSYRNGLCALFLERHQPMRQSSLISGELMTMYLVPQSVHELKFGQLSFMHS